MIRQTTIPFQSKLATAAFDYYDCFETALPEHPTTITMPMIGQAFFEASPTWINYLFNLRNRLVRRLGLKVPEPIADREKLPDDFTCTPGQRVGLFKVFASDQREVVLGEDDKHLDFRVSLYQRSATEAQPRSLAITTIVSFNHWSGRLYFRLIKPFHKIIVKQMLRGTVKNLSR
ncbi:MAG: DUF2867 domain-containing protein [Bacteroidota bacterium]